VQAWRKTSKKWLIGKNNMIDSIIPLLSLIALVVVIGIDNIILDLVFSVVSIITAVGMVQELWVMYTTVIVIVIKNE